MALRDGFTLGTWVVHPLEGRLSRPGESRRVQPKSMEVLLCLAEASGAVVERDTLLRKIWGERAVSDEPLTRCIGELRRALGDNRADPEFILTIPKRGYRLIPVPAPLRDDKATPPVHKSRGKAVFVLLAIATLIATFFLQRQGANVGDELIADQVEQARSIAVIPFADMSEFGDQEYMSDGIAEELLNLLAKVHNLRVISRTSAFAFKGKQVEVREIAARLNVAYVLEGSVRTSGDQIRVTTQLIDARTDSHIWSETYERELKDIFRIQDEIAAAVVSKLELTLLSGTPRARETSPEAYSLFLQARFLHEHTGDGSFARAFEYYEAALDADENYVPAWVWLAALYDDTVNSSDLPYEEVGQRARAAIDRALAIDPNDPLALGMSSLLADAWDNDVTSAAALMQKALSIDPGNPILLRWAAILLNSLGRFEDAIRVSEYLLERDPIGNIAMINLASIYLAAGRFDDAVRVCEIEVALSSASSPCQARLIIGYLLANDAENALELLQQVPGSRVHVRLAPMVLHSLGRQSDFETALAELQQAFQAGDKGLAYWLGRTFVFAGDHGAALTWFETAADAGVLNVAPGAAYFTELQGVPRWEALMNRTGRTEDSLRNIDLTVPVPAF